MENISISTTGSFGFGWRKFKEKGLFFIGIAVFVAILSSIQQLPQIFHDQASSSLSGVYFSLLTTIIGTIVSTYLSLGVWKIMIMHSRGEEIDFSDLLKISFRNFSHYILACILTGIATIIGLICLIVPGIHIALRLIFIPAFIVDKDQSFDEAMKSSWAITKGSTVKLFIWSLLATLVVIIGFFLLIAGIFVAMPVASLALAFIYLKLSNEDLA